MESFNLNVPDDYLKEGEYLDTRLCLLYTSIPEARWMMLFTRNLREPVTWNWCLTVSYLRNVYSLQLTLDVYKRQGYHTGYDGAVY